MNNNNLLLIDCVNKVLLFVSYISNFVISYKIGYHTFYKCLLQKLFRQGNIASFIHTQPISYKKYIYILWIIALYNLCNMLDIWTAFHQYESSHGSKSSKLFKKIIKKSKSIFIISYLPAMHIGKAPLAKPTTIQADACMNLLVTSDPFHWWEMLSTNRTNVSILSGLT